MTEFEKLKVMLRLYMMTNEITANKTKLLSQLEYADRVVYLDCSFHVTRELAIYMTQEPRQEPVKAFVVGVKSKQAKEVFFQDWYTPSGLIRYGIKDKIVFIQEVI